MNPPTRVKAWKDTTYFLMLAAVQRGHQVCWFDQDALWLKHNHAHAKVTWLDVHDDHKNPFTTLTQEEIDLSKMDAVWIRTDPPFDRRYFYTTLMLDYLPTTTRVINRPSGIRNWNEKLAALHYPKFSPQTLISNDIKQIKNFAKNFNRITLKPIDGFGGKGIVFYKFGDDEKIIKQATENQSHKIIAQEYLPAATQGDKRILLLNGEPLGAILRLHADGEELNNLDAGATAHPSKLTATDKKICTAIKPGLIKQGIFFAGIDIIGDKLIEINVTSPTGLQELTRFTKTDHHHKIIAALE